MAAFSSRMACRIFLLYDSVATRSAALKKMSRLSNKLDCPQLSNAFAALSTADLQSSLDADADWPVTRADIGFRMSKVAFMLEETCSPLM